MKLKFLLESTESFAGLLAVLVWEWSKNVAVIFVDVESVRM